MNIKLSIWVFYSILILIFGCANLKTKYLDPEYQELSSSASVLIIPLDDHFEDISGPNSDKVMKPEERREFNSLFGKIFSQYTSADIYGIEPNYSLNKNAFSRRFLKLGNTTFEVMLPDSNYTLGHEGTTPDFVLFLQNHHFDIDQTTESFSASGSFNARQGYALAFKGTYVIWDNRTQESIGWGTLDQLVTFTQEATSENYITLLELVAREIIDHSPFRSR